jgi:hypothetical protein
VAGFRHGAKSVYWYRATKAGQWDKQVLDDAMAGATCAAGDLNGDRAGDWCVIGAANLKWYENLSREKRRCTKTIVPAALTS